MHDQAQPLPPMQTSEQAVNRLANEYVEQHPTLDHASGVTLFKASLAFTVLGAVDDPGASAINPSSTRRRCPLLEAGTATVASLGANMSSSRRVT